MTLFHHHEWQEVKRRFQPGLKALPEIKGPMACVVEQVDKMTWGFTSIELQCRTCGKVEIDTVQGDQR